MFKRDLTPKSKNLYTLLTLLAVVIAAMVFIVKSTHGERPDHPAFTGEYARAGGDTLNVAIEMNPDVYMVRGDSASGRDYEILMHICSKHSRPVKLYPFVPLQKALDGLENGLFDLVVASIPATTQLKKDYLMTTPVYLDREILVQRNDDPVTSQVQLGGDTIWLTANSPFRQRIENMAAEIGEKIYIKSSPEYSAEALFILVAKGKIKYAVINEGIAKKMKERYQDVNIETPISFTQFQAWMLKRDNRALCDTINAWIAADSLFLDTVADQQSVD